MDTNQSPTPPHAPPPREISKGHSSRVAPEEEAVVQAKYPGR